MFVDITSMKFFRVSIQMIEFDCVIIILLIFIDPLKTSFVYAGTSSIENKNNSCFYFIFFCRNVRWSLLSLFALFDLPVSLQNRLLHLICSIDDQQTVTGSPIFIPSSRIRILRIVFFYSSRELYHHGSNAEFINTK